MILATMVQSQATPCYCSDCDLVAKGQLTNQCLFLQSLFCEELQSFEPNTADFQNLTSILKRNYDLLCHKLAPLPEAYGGEFPTHCDAVASGARRQSGPQMGIRVSILLFVAAVHLTYFF